MKHDQDMITQPITIGEYVEIVAPVYTDNTDLHLETALASGVVEWHLIGVSGSEIISKTTAGSGGITVNSPSSGSITIEIHEEDTTGLSKGDYYHIAEFTISGHTRGLFDGIARLK